MKRFEWDQKEPLLKKFDEETKEWKNIELGKKNEHSEKVEQEFKNKHLTMVDIDLFCGHHEKDRLEMVNMEFAHDKQPYNFGWYHCNICDYVKEIGEFTEVYLCTKCKTEGRHTGGTRKPKHHIGFDICHECYTAMKFVICAHLDEVQSQKITTIVDVKFQIRGEPRYYRNEDTRLTKKSRKSSQRSKVCQVSPKKALIKKVAEGNEGNITKRLHKKNLSKENTNKQIHHEPQYKHLPISNIFRPEKEIFITPPKLLG